MKITTKINYEVEMLMNTSASKTRKSKHRYKKEIVLLNMHWIRTSLKWLLVTAVKFSVWSSGSNLNWRTADTPVFKLISVWAAFPWKDQYSVISSRQLLEPCKSAELKRSTHWWAWHLATALLRDLFSDFFSFDSRKKKRDCRPHLEGYSTFLLIRYSSFSFFLFYYNPMLLFIISHSHSYIAAWTCPDHFDLWREIVSFRIL